MKNIGSITKLAVASAVGFTGLVAAAGASPVEAACDYREICFYQDNNGGGGEYDTQTRTLSHTNLYFDNGTPLRDEADSVKNRDSSCEIKVIDDRGFYPDDVVSIPNDGLLRNLPSSVDNENDRHERGSC